MDGRITFGAQAEGCTRAPWGFVVRGGMAAGRGAGTGIVPGAPTTPQTPLVAAEPVRVIPGSMAPMLRGALRTTIRAFTVLPAVPLLGPEGASGLLA